MAETIFGAFVFGFGYVWILVMTALVTLGTKFFWENRHIPWDEWLAYSVCAFCITVLNLGLGAFFGLWVGQRFALPADNFPAFLIPIWAIACTIVIACYWLVVCVARCYWQPKRLLR